MLSRGQPCDQPSCHFLFANFSPFSTQFILCSIFRGKLPHNYSVFISNLPTNVFAAALSQVKKTNKQKNETKQIKAKQTNIIFEIDGYTRNWWYIEVQVDNNYELCLFFSLHFLKIYEDNQLNYFLDGSDKNTSSWMRFIRCARHKQEQNLFAFQHNKSIFYRAYRDIPRGCELLVWYEDSYTQHMGIPVGIGNQSSSLQFQGVVLFFNTSCVDQ